VREDPGIVALCQAMAYRLELLDKLDQKERERILNVIDALLRDAQLSHTQQKLAHS
jgi:hypothetical protein